MQLSVRGCDRLALPVSSMGEAEGSTYMDSVCFAVG